MTYQTEIELNTETEFKTETEFESQASAYPALNKWVPHHLGYNCFFFLLSMQPL